MTNIQFADAEMRSISTYTLLEYQDDMQDPTFLYELE
jgi:hypothetical protein